MADVELEAVFRTERGGDHLPTPLVDLPRGATRRAVQVAMLAGRQDVELLAPVCVVAVANEADLLEEVESSVHGRGRRPGVTGPASLDQLGAGDVPIRSCEHLDNRLPLRCPAQAAAPQHVADRLR